MDILSTIGKVAPVLATAIGGPVGGLVTEFVCSLLGIKHEDLPSYAADPNNAVKLQEIESQYKIQLAQLSANNFSKEIEDTASARNREIEEEKITGKRDWFVPILAASFVAIYAIIQIYAIYSPGNQDDVISARLQDIILMICGYYWGNSHRKE